MKSIAIAVSAVAVLALQPAVGIVERGVLPVSWITAAACPESPIFITHEYNADFFILLSGGGGSAARVDSVKFVSGDEKLKSFSAALKTADYHLTFPDDTPVKIFRRGTLSCAVATGKCEFVLTRPDDVISVD